MTTFAFMQRESTKIKVVCGYVLLTLLLFFSIQYIYRKIRVLTSENTYEQKLTRQRHITNQIVINLYQAEITSQSFGIGQLDYYDAYRQSMQKACIYLDTLRSTLTDKKQLMRVDSMQVLVKRKENNVLALLETLRNNSTDKFYQHYIRSLEKQQDALLNRQPVVKTMVTHSDVYTIRRKPKKLLKRIAEIFSPLKGDTVKMENVTREVTTDTIKSAVNPSDTVAKLLKHVQRGVNSRRQQSVSRVKDKIGVMRTNGMKLSSQINAILQTIEYTEQALLENKVHQEKQIKENAAHAITFISIAATLLAALFLLLIWRDITRSVRYRQKLEESKQYAEDLLAAREKMMLTITHDIKAPAGSILGYLELMSRIVKEGREKFYLGNMKKSAQHLLELVRSLLDFYKLDAHKMDVNKVTFDVEQLFNDIYLGFKPIAEAKKIELIYRHDAIEQKNYMGDAFRIRQIVDNLLSNSMKFTKEGKVTLQMSVNIKSLQISVSDTGCGMSLADQKTIFQEFTRLSNAQGQEGFGLGLSIVMKLVKLLGGDIRLQSEVGKGTDFYVTIPIEETERQLAKKDITCKVLLIDDDPIQLQLTAAMLEQLGVRATTCERPETLLRMLKEEDFDIIFTDIQMPAMNGLDLIKMIRATGRQQLPVVAITARSDMDKDSLLEKGFAGCLHKPFNLSELQQIIIDNCRQGAIVEQKIADTSVYNFSTLKAFSDGSTDGAATIMNTFISEMKKNKEMLNTALLGGDIKTIAMIAHKMIPTMKMIDDGKILPPLLSMEQEKQSESIDDERRKEVGAVIVEIDRLVDAAIKSMGKMDKNTPASLS
jgi:signal transduction histidine kinase/DNA-binding NarL/FixJ family response regulator